MSEISGFEQFKEIFDAYFSKWWKIASILLVFVYLLAFGLYTIGLLNKSSDIVFPSFLRTIVTAEYWSWTNDRIIEVIDVGFIAIGGLPHGVVSIGAVFPRYDLYGCVFCRYFCVWWTFFRGHRYRGRHPPRVLRYLIRAECLYALARSPRCRRGCVVYAVAEVQGGVVSCLLGRYSEREKVPAFLESALLPMLL